MDRTERFYKVDQLLNDRRSVPMNTLIEELGISRATVKRDIEYMRDRLNAPITWDRSLRGYRFDRSLPGAEKYSLPGLWFNDQEIFALLTMYQMLSNLGNGLLTPHIEPLLARLNAVMGSQADSADEIRKRIRILHMAARTDRPEQFEAVASATIRRRRLVADHSDGMGMVGDLADGKPEILAYEQGARWNKGLSEGSDAAVQAALDLITNFSQGDIDPALMALYSPGSKFYKNLWETC